MSCVRCQADEPLSKAGWCSACEKAYDTWVRQHATDIIWSVLGGGIVLGAVGIGLPLLGLSSIVAFAAAFTGFATISGCNGSRRAGGASSSSAVRAMPRAYLPSPQR